MIIIGVSFGYHDSAIAFVNDGEIAFASQEERYTRVKNDKTFPKNALKAGLKQLGVKLNQIDIISYYEIPELKKERQITSSIESNSISLWTAKKLARKTKLLTRDNLVKLFDSSVKSESSFQGDVVATAHHLSHASSAFFPSPFREAGILTIDGVGEWATTTIGKGCETEVTIFKEMHFPHSIGLLYSAITELLGFKVNSGEYKVMGLAPYGEVKYLKQFDELIYRNDDGSYSINSYIFEDWMKNSFVTHNLQDLFRLKKRGYSDELKQVHADIAATLQFKLNEIVVDLSVQTLEQAESNNLCLAGGVALNCVSNSQILKKTNVREVFIQPAAGDAGGALGAALYTHYFNEGNKSKRLRQISYPDSMKGAFLGQKYSTIEIQNDLSAMNAKYSIISDKKILFDLCSNSLIMGKAIGWFQGASEFGPRALGGRSILADPRSENIQSRLNLKTKFRESFRPFAPVILQEFMSDWFEDIRPSPYMLFTYQVKNAKLLTAKKIFEGITPERLNLIDSPLPGVTHLDLSARVQTVNRESNEPLYDLLLDFYKKTGCPALVNTSFNVRGEPIVNSVYDAYECFMRTDLDILVIDQFIMYKENQVGDSVNHKSFPLD